VTKSIAVVAALALVGTAGLSLAATTPAHASVLMTLQQETGAASCGGASTCVVASVTNGTLDLTDLHFSTTFTNFTAFIDPQAAAVTVGATGSADVYTGVNGPPNFGSGGNQSASTMLGDIIAPTGGTIAVPSNYSGTVLSGSATWDSTLAMLGVIPGTYLYTWGTGAHADSVTLEILNPVPVPAALTLFATGLGLLGLIFGGSRWAIRTV
jgi:hypothetical protein